MRICTHSIRDVRRLMFTQNKHHQPNAHQPACIQSGIQIDMHSIKDVCRKPPIQNRAQDRIAFQQIYIKRNANANTHSHIRNASNRPHTNRNAFSQTSSMGARYQAFTQKKRRQPNAYQPVYTQLKTQTCMQTLGGVRHQTLTQKGRHQPNNIKIVVHSTKNVRRQAFTQKKRHRPTTFQPVCT